MDILRVWICGGWSGWGGWVGVIMGQDCRGKAGSGAGAGRAPRCIRISGACGTQHCLWRDVQHAPAGFAHAPPRLAARSPPAPPGGPGAAAPHPACPCCRQEGQHRQGWVSGGGAVGVRWAPQPPAPLSHSRIHPLRPRRRVAVPRPAPAHSAGQHPPVGHADEQDVVQRVHAVNLGQQLVDHGVVHAAAVAHAAARLAHRVDFVENDDVQVWGARERWAKWYTWHARRGWTAPAAPPAALQLRHPAGASALPTGAPCTVQPGPLGPSQAHPRPRPCARSRPQRP